MKKKRIGLWLNIVTIAMCLCAIAIGVYSAKQASLTVSGSIGFTAHNCKVNVSGKLDAYVKESEGSNTLTSKTKYFNEGNSADGTPKLIEGNGSTYNWDIGAIFFDDLNCSNDQIATPIVFTFTMTNESVSYDVFAQFGFEGDLQTKLDISIDFTTSVENYDVLYSADRLCVLESDKKVVTATITLTPKEASDFSYIDLSNFKINFYKQPTATETSTTGEYEYNNLIYTIDTKNTGYVKVKANNKSLTGDIVVPPQMEINGSIYQIKLGDSGYSFASCNNITSVALPNTIETMGEVTFYSCEKLISVTIPDNITSIGYMSFQNCTSLTSITIPSSLTSIEIYAFSGCSGLTSINFQGTKVQWNAITKGSSWDSSTGDYTIHCTDGDIAKS